LSNKLADIIAEIQFKTKLTQEEIAERIGYSRPYLSNAIKKNAGGKVYQTIMKEFGEVLQNVSFSNNEDEHKNADPVLETENNLAHISAAHNELSLAHRLQSEILLIEAKKGQSLGDTNKELVLLLKNSGAPLKNEPAPLPPFEVAYYELLQVGVLEGRWRSMDEARAKLDKIVYENQVQQSESYKHSSDSN
jgi:transcriptional regulator with XRE-family HTH domain